MPTNFPNGSGPPETPEQLIEDFLNRFRGGGGTGTPSAAGVIGGLLAAFTLWMGTGIYQINPSEIGVVLRFGRVSTTTEPGLHWHFPRPIETVTKVPVTVVQKQEIGFRTIDGGPPARYRPVVEEARMLTQDGNIVDLDFIVQYRIKDPIAYLFAVRDPVETVRACAESAMREGIGGSTIDRALTEGRAEIQLEAQDLLQDMLDNYNSGIQVTTVKLQDVSPPDPVQDAFKDVINAEQDKERMINEAQGFSNDILPKARGTAAQRINEAEAYAEAVVKDAEGEAGRFELVYAAYAEAPAITRKRLYIETMEAVLPTVNKIVVDEGIAGRVLPLLPLDGVLNPTRGSAAAASASETGGESK